MFETADIPTIPEVLTLIAEIDEFKGAWRVLGTLAPERLSALRRVATKESIGSSRALRAANFPTTKWIICLGSWLQIENKEHCEFGHLFQAIEFRLNSQFSAA
jgi:hypothetical protein